MAIYIGMIVKQNNDYKQVEYSYIHNGSLNNFDFDIAITETIENTKKCYKTDFVKFDEIIIR